MNDHVEGSMVRSRLSLWLVMLGAVACGNSERSDGTENDGAGHAGVGAEAGNDGASGATSSSGGTNASGGGSAGTGGSSGVGGTTNTTGGAGATSGGSAGADNEGGGSGTNGGNGTSGGSAGGGAGGAAAQAGAGGNPSGGTGIIPPTGPAECRALDTTGGRANDASGGSAGSLGGATGACTIAATATLATIPTVGIVTFTVSGMSDVASAKIDFVRASGGATLTAPVTLTETDYRTLLLGMKANTRYVYRVSVTGSSGTCTSSEYSLQTGAVPEDVPKLIVTVMNESARAKGFIVATTGTGLGEGAPRDHAYTYIVDSDGDPVWWAEGGGLSAHMSWEGLEMYVLGGGGVSSVSMDGSRNAMNPVTGAHHDVTAIPGGFATLVGSSLVERAADGTLTTVVPDVATLYPRGGAAVHTNALHYYGWDDSYTISDLYVGTFIKVTRRGELAWQMGGPLPLATDPPRDPAKYYRTAGGWGNGPHGHHLSPDGTLVFFTTNGRCGNGSGVNGFRLDPATMNANALFTFGLDAWTEHFGEVQRLPNGNYLATISEAGRMIEFTAAGTVVATFVAREGEFGYGEFRETLYGPPPY